MDKNKLLQDLNRYNQIKEYLMKIADILGDGVNKVDKIHESMDKNCNILNEYSKFKKEIINNKENVDNLLKIINEKIKVLNVSLNQIV